MSGQLDGIIYAAHLNNERFNMKNLFTLLLLTIMLSAAAQSNSKTCWPIKDAKPGENIIGNPGVPINGEANYNNLFISAKEGCAVEAPVDGIVTSFSYFYSNSLTYCMGGSKVTTTDVKEELAFRREFAKDISINTSNKGSDVAKYVSVSMGILTCNGETFYINGLRPVRIFKTGFKVKKGDIIGTVGYAYSAFSIPHIKVSRSVNGESVDPMGIFGIPSTFKKYKPRKYDYVNYRNPVDSLRKDFAIFRKSLEEIHPGLYDYINKATMDSLVAMTEAMLTVSMTTREFGRILRPIMKAIRDSHTWMGYSEPMSLPKRLSVTLGYDGKKVFIADALPNSGCKKWDEVVEIDGENAIKLVSNAKENSYNFEGYNLLPVERDIMQNLTLYASAYSLLKGLSINLKLKNGRVVTPLLVPVSKSPSMKFHSWAPQHSTYVAKMINTTTAYLDINTFQLNQMKEDSIEHFIQRIHRQGVKNIIIDLRDNRGGSIEVGNRIISYFINTPKKTFCYKMVKSNTTYPILKYSSNWSCDMEIFPEYKKVEGKEFFYDLDDRDSTVVRVLNPNSKTHYKGNIVILVNEFSVSMASDFPAALYGQKNCRIVGRETGSSYYQMNAEKFAEIRMSATGLLLSIPMVKLVLRDIPNSKIPWGHGVIPDYNVPLTYDELTKPKDIILDKALELIHSLK